MDRNEFQRAATWPVDSFDVADRLNPDHIDGLVSKKEVDYLNDADLVFADYDFDGLMSRDELQRAKLRDAFTVADKARSGYLDGLVSRKDTEKWSVNIYYQDLDRNGLMDRKEYEIALSGDRFYMADYSRSDKVDNLITKKEAERAGVTCPKNQFGDASGKIWGETTVLFSDTNHDGFMDRAEYESAKDSISKDHAERRGLQFFDPNNDGYMTRDEWAKGTLKASGMEDTEVERYAPFLSKQDTWWLGGSWVFANQISDRLNLLATKIKEGASAGDALLCSIFSTPAFTPIADPTDWILKGAQEPDEASKRTAENLGDPEFLKDLSTAFYDNGSSVADCKQFALDNLAKRQAAAAVASP